MPQSDLTISPAEYGGDRMPWAEYVIAGNIVFLSGAEGRDVSKKQEYPDGEPAESPVYPTIEEQTRACLEKIVERVRKAGTTPENIAVINYYVTDRANWEAVWRTCVEFWGEHCPDINDRPRAGTLLVNVGLDRPDMLIEIEAIAYKP
ncbi:MAG TPA: Rid family hydrolase [Gaiellaceae bacterium]|nr:Rid family hydrolase [Gaiellaceae bacterium]